MAFSKLLNLMALSTLAILICSFGPTPTAALTTGSHNVARHLAHAHGSIAKKKKRSNNRKRCQANTQPTASLTSSADPAPSATSSADAPQSSSDSSDSGNSGNSGNSGSGSSGGSGSGGTGGEGGGKVGLAWPNGDSDNLASFITSQVSVVYTWSPDAVGQNLGVTFCPMLWGYNQISDFQQLVVPGYSNCAMGMNEPNEPGQSNMDAGAGVALWQQYLQPLRSQGYRLISPATSSSPTGKQWMQDFRSQCSNDDCTWDVVALHWYDVNAQDFIAYVTDFYNTFNAPIWVTEFACQNFNGGPQASYSDVMSFLSQVIGWMDGTDMVEHYFLFGAMEDMQGVNTANQIMGSDGTPNSLGQAYINNNPGAM